MGDPNILPRYIQWSNVGNKISSSTDTTRQTREKPLSIGIVEDILGVNLNNEETINANKIRWAGEINGRAATMEYFQNVLGLENEIPADILTNFLPPHTQQVYSMRLENMRESLKQYNTNGGNFPYTKSTSEEIISILNRYETLHGEGGIGEVKNAMDGQVGRLNEYKQLIGLSGNLTEAQRQGQYLARNRLNGQQQIVNELTKKYKKLLSSEKNLQNELRKIFLNSPSFNINVTERRDDDNFVARLWSSIQQPREVSVQDIQKKIVVNDNNNLNIVNKATGEVIEDNIAGPITEITSKILSDRVYIAGNDKFVATLKIPLTVLPNGLYIQTPVCVREMYWRFRHSNKINTTKPLFGDVPYDKLREKELIVSKIPTSVEGRSGFRLPTGKIYFDLALCINTTSGEKICSELITSSDLRRKMVHMVKDANKRGLYKNPDIPLSKMQSLTKKAVSIVERGAGQTIRGHGQLRHIPGSEWQILRERVFNLIEDGYWQDYPNLLSQEACLILEPTILLSRDEYNDDLLNANNLRVGGFDDIPLGGIYVLCADEEIERGGVRNEVLSYNRMRQRAQINYQLILNRMTAIARLQSMLRERIRRQGEEARRQEQEARLANDEEQMRIAANIQRNVKRLEMERQNLENEAKAKQSEMDRYKDFLDKIDKYNPKDLKNQFLKLPQQIARSTNKTLNDIGVSMAKIVRSKSDTLKNNAFKNEKPLLEVLTTQMYNFLLNTVSEAPKIILNAR